MRHVLISGSNGFVGCNLVKCFAENGDFVDAVDRAAPDDMLRSYLKASLDRVSFVRADICDPQWFRALPDRPLSVAIHAAAVTNVAEGDEATRARDAVSVNAGGTANFMAWAAMARPQRIIHISSSSVYGFILDGEGAIDESQPLLPGNIYGITKLAAEQIALRLAQLANLHLVAARLSGPYGPMERPSADRKRLSPIHDWCVAAAKGEPILVQQGHGPRDFSYVADTADAIYQLATAPAPRHTIYNVTSGVVVTGEEIVSTLQRIVPGLQIRRSDVPGVNLITRPISIDRLTADTGWKPRYDLQSALADYVGWLRRHHARFSAER